MTLTLLVAGMLAASADEREVIYRPRQELGCGGPSSGEGEVDWTEAALILPRPLTSPGDVLSPLLTLRQSFTRELSDSARLIAPTFEVRAL